MTELEKYQGIYSSPKEYGGYGHENCGSGAKDLIKAWGTQSLVDVGCGWNELCRWANQEGIRAVGVDFACTGADIKTSATQLPFFDKSYDLVTAFDTLEHLTPEEVPIALREFARISQAFCFSICHRASVITWDGENLHPTVQSEEWWIERIKEAGASEVTKHGRYLYGDWGGCQPVPDRKLTIGMLTHSDFHGVYFSIQSIQLHHPEILKDVEFLILDNSPESKHGKAVKDLTNWVIKSPIRYMPITDATGTALRDRIFKLASTPYVLCMDSHVMFPSGALSKLIEFLDAGKDEGSLLHGPLLYDNMDIGATHMEPVWRDSMLGIWAVDHRGLDENAEPFEIPAHGMGVFACRKDAWLGFNPDFREFGGEECYIHEKYRQAGKKSLCLPFLRWLHRFPRPDGVPYAISMEARVRNYIIGHRELGLPLEPILEHFKTSIPKDMVLSIEKEILVTC